MSKEFETNGLEIAVVGMSVNLCDCEDVAGYWQKLLAGEELLSTLSEDELQNAGIDQAVWSKDNYVPVASKIENRFDFDAPFFDYVAREAEFMDPQLRLAHQCVYQALHEAGAGKRDFDGTVGTYMGSSFNLMWLQYVNQVCSGNLLELHDLRTLFQSEFFASRIAHNLNLTGPAVNVSATCATASVAIHMAAQGLLSGDCDLALAGAACVSPNVEGYEFYQNMIQSSDGHCRVFDDHADGTIFGNGVGVVALKRLDDAIEEGNYIHAVLKGSAINNDGDDKAGYTAPSVSGQCNVIDAAIEAAELDYDEMDFVECHGTATKIGDPIEIEALKHTYGNDSEQPIWLGSVKSNLGHLDTAAGVVGFIKAVMAVKKGVLPKTLHFNRLNRNMDLTESNLNIAAEGVELEQTHRPLRGGVSSFGIGGTNAHLIVEQYIEERVATPSARRFQLLPFSAKSEASTSAYANALADNIENEAPELDALAFTLQRKDPGFMFRSAVIGQDINATAESLSARQNGLFFNGHSRSNKVAFMFPGQGSQYVGMAANLYSHDSAFAHIVDECMAQLEGDEFDTIKALFFSRDVADGAEMAKTQYAQPLLFIVEYALAKHLMNSGVTPDYMLGHSLGEYVAATLAGVFSLSDALRIVCRRGQLMSQAPKGRMLSVSGPFESYANLVKEGVSCASFNSDNLNVFSGSEQDITQFKASLEAQNINCQLLHTSHAYHCHLMDDCLEPFRMALEGIELNAPTLDFYSNVTGELITDSQATAVDYWVSHIRQPVRFAQAVGDMLQQHVNLFVEAGPGRVLSTFVKDHHPYNAVDICVNTLPHPRDTTDDELFFQQALAHLYCLGCDIDWQYYQGDAEPLEVELPPYQFDKQSYHQVVGRPLPAQTQAAQSQMETIGEQQAPAAKVSHDRPEQSVRYIAPEGDIQIKLAQCWCDIFALNTVGAEDNFFELGGHSLVAIRVLNFIEAEFEQTLSVSQLFAEPTIAGLAELVEQALTQQKVQQSRQDIEVVEREAAMPASFQQQRMWFIDQFQGGSSNYNLPLPMLVEGPFDLERAKTCINIIVERHEILRTRYGTDKSGVVQYIDDSAEVDINIIDLKGLSELEQNAQMQTLASEDALKPYDLRQDLMLRVSYLALAEQRGLLLFNMHHIASDGWSFRVLMNEFIPLYRAQTPNAELLPALSVQYADFAAWQNEQLSGENLTRLSQYWTETLADAPTIHSLPLSGKRVGKTQPQGAKRQDLLDNEKTQALQALAKKYEVTPFILLHAAFSQVLARFSNTSDVVVGTPIANRNHGKIEPLIGYFVNTLVLRSGYDGAQSLSDYLAYIKDVNFNAMAHQELPFEKLIDLLNLKRTDEYLPLVQVMLSVDTNDTVDSGIEGLTFEEYRLDVAQPQFELDLFVNFREHGLVFDWIYDADLFSHELIEQLGYAMQAVLNQMLEGSVEKVSDFDIITDEHRQLVHDMSTGPEVPFHEDKLLHEYFDEQAAQNPEALALVFRQQKLNYGQFSDLVNQHANWMREQGVKPETLVGVYMERSVEMVLALMSIVKAGGAYVPLDPEHPPARTQVIIEEAGIDLVLSQCHLSERCEMVAEKATQCRFVPLDDDNVRAKVCTHSTVAERHPDGSSSNMVYIIYTSGSTGKPKGVMLEHRAINNRIEWAQNQMPMTSEDKFLQKTPFGFDVSVWEFFWPFCYGAALVVAEPNGHKDPLYLSKLTKQQDVTVLHFVPSMLNAFLSFEDAKLAPSVKRVLCSGEALNTSDVKGMQARCPHVTIHNLYGPTEAAIDVSYFNCDDVDNYIGVPIGKPIQNIGLYVLDGQMNLVPVGTPGELHIAGVGLARGYFNREDLTEKAFVEHQFEDGRKARLYKTGDLCRYLPDGQIDYLGRIDHQVKLRGLRIELGEIEAHMNKLDSVDSSLAIVAEQGASGTLVAYVKPTEMPQDDEAVQAYNERMQSALGVGLPEYMVPDRIILIEQWPQTPNGKIDRKNLPSLEIELDGDYVAPRTAKEQTLVEIWAELLKIDSRKLSIEANFFELGGDSILCIQVVSRAAKAGLVFKVRDMYEATTVQSLAELAKEGVGVDAPQGPVEGETALLPIAQEFFKDLTDWHHFNQAVLLKTPEQFDCNLLKEMVAQLYQKHDVLRLRFDQKEHGFIGVYRDFDEAIVDWAIESVEWTEDTFDNLPAHADKVQKQLSPAQGLNAKIVYYRKADCEGRLLMAFHHLVVDGVSWRIVLEDMATLYQQYQQHQPYDLGFKTSSFSQWVEFAQEYSASEQLSDELAYWQKQTEIEVTPLIERGRANAAKSDAAKPETIEIEFDEATTRVLLTDCQKVFNTQINQLLLAGLSMAARRWGNLESIRVDMEGHGRESLSDVIDTSQTMGWFTSLYPMTLQHCGESIAELVAGIKGQYSQLPQNGIGFGWLKYFAGAQALQSVETSEMVFNYLGQFDQGDDGQHGFSFAEEGNGLTVSARRKPMHPLALNGLVSNNRLRFSLTLDSNQYDVELMNEFMLEFRYCILDIVDFVNRNEQVFYHKSDFPLARMNETELAQWTDGHRDVVDIYPATGMQQGLLFHSMIDPGAYVIQLTMELSDVDLDAFKQAWELLVQTKDILRTRFVGLESGNIHQVVHQNAELNWMVEDATELTESQQKALLQTRLKEIKPSFALDQAMLLNIHILTLDDSRHQLIWSWHHALIDGWCIPIIMTELTEYYAQLVAGKPTQLFESPSFSHYIEWLEGQDQQKARDFWADQLKDVEAATPLPLLSEEASSETMPEIFTEVLELNDEQMQALQVAAQACQVTVNVIFQAAWGLMLSQFSNESTVVFGGTTSGRPPQLRGVERTIGLFINSLPMVLDVDPGQSLKDWLQQVQNRIVDTEEYNFLPLTTIQQQSAVTGSLFDSLIVFENYPINEHLLDQVSNAGLGVSNVELDEVNNYKLSIKINTAANYHIQFTGRDGYTPKKLSDIREYFLNILMSMVAQTSLSKVSDIQMLAQPQFDDHVLSRRHAVLDEFPVENFFRVDSKFADYAKDNPQQTALVFNHRRYSYREVNERANQMANLLIEKGVVGNSPVGILLERSAQTYIAILAVLKSGGAYLPIDSGFPPGRVEQMLQQADAKHLITTENLIESVELADDMALLCLDNAAMQSTLAQSSNQNPVVELSPSDIAQQLCYIIFTSGSTGTPKGVMLSHKNLWSYLESIVRRHNVGMGLSYAIMTSTATDLGNTALFLAMTRGGCLHMMADHQVRDAKFFCEYNRDNVIDVIKMTPSHFAALYTPDVLEVQQNRFVFLGGERIDENTSQILQSLKAKNDATIINHYGPTEATIGCFTHEIDVATLQAQKAIPVGKPLDNINGYILSPTLQPVPDGVVGQLYVGGAGISQGYLNNPEMTEQSFITSPFKPLEGEHDPERLYNTGDLAVRRLDGKTEFMGRADAQLKLRGYRIELAEIAVQIESLAMVDSAQVLVDAEQPGQERIIAYVKLTRALEDEQDVKALLTEQLSRNLPNYMLPSDFIVMTEWPLTANGKIDRKALPKPDSLFEQSDYVAPQTQTETELVDICGTLLSVDAAKLSLAASFFELGGHSLLLIRLINEIDNHFGVPVAVAEVFEMQTLKELAAHIDGALQLKQLDEQIDDVETEDEGWF